MWVPARWGLTAFEVGMFTMAAGSIVRRILRKQPIGLHPVGVALAMAEAWGVVQIAAHRTVYELKTWEAVLGWILNLAAFSLAAELVGEVEHRERFLSLVLIF